MSNSRRQEIQVGVLIAVAMALLAWLSIKVGAVSGLGPTIGVELRMKDAAGISAGAAVSVAGVQVGRVETMQLVRDTAVARLSIESQHEVPRDVAARIRARSVLGEKYLELVPTGLDGPLLADGDVLVIEGDQVEIDEMISQIGTVLSALDPEALGAALKSVSDALKADPGRLQRAFDYLDTILKNGATASEDLPGLVDQVGGTMDRADHLIGTFDARGAEAKSPIARADRLLGTLERDVPKALDEGRDAIRSAKTAVDHADRSLNTVDGALADARDLIGEFDGIGGDAKSIAKNFSAIDKWELRRLLREEGILIRLQPDEVVPSEARTMDVVPPAGRHPDKR